MFMKILIILEAVKRSLRKNFNRSTGFRNGLLLEKISEVLFLLKQLAFDLYGGKDQELLKKFLKMLKRIENKAKFLFQ